jgi:hypothetical protein
MGAISNASTAVSAHVGRSDSFSVCLEPYAKSSGEMPGQIKAITTLIYLLRFGSGLH